MSNALGNTGVSLYLRVKRASPSKGLIAEDLFLMWRLPGNMMQPVQTVYRILTEPKWFLGSDEIFKEIRAPLPFL